MKHTHVGNFPLKIPDALQLGIKHYVMGVEGCPPTLVDKTSECPQGLLSPSASGQQPFLPLQMSSPPPIQMSATIHRNYREPPIGRNSCSHTWHLCVQTINESEVLDLYVIDTPESAVHRLCITLHKQRCHAVGTRAYVNGGMQT